MTEQPPIVLTEHAHKNAAKFRDTVRPNLIYTTQEWLDYDPAGFYFSIDHDAMRAELARFMIEAKRLILVEGQAIKQAIPFNPRGREVSETLDFLQDLCHTAHEGFRPFWIDGRTTPKPENVIACANGLLDLDSGKLHPHTPAFCTRQALPVLYDDLDFGKPTAFLKFLLEAMAGREHLVGVVQQMLGYLLTSDTSQQKVFFLLGQSRAGKGTLMRIIRALIGDRNVGTPSIDDFKQRWWSWDLRAKSVALITELSVSDKAATRIAASRINAISGEDPVNAEGKNRDALTGIMLPTRIVAGGNLMPDFGEHGMALANRLIIIPFDVSFLGREDHGLTAHIVENELGKVLLWALEGLRDLRKAGRFVEPNESKLEKDDLARIANPLGNFIETQCVRDPAAKVKKDALYTRYVEWCTERRLVPLSGNIFARRLYEQFPETRGAARGRNTRGGKRVRENGKQPVYYPGLRLAEPQHVGQFDFEAALEQCRDYGLTDAEAIEYAKAERQAFEAEPG